MHFCWAICDREDDSYRLHFAVAKMENQASVVSKGKKGGLCLRLSTVILGKRARNMVVYKTKQKKQSMGQI